MILEVYCSNCGYLFSSGGYYANSMRLCSESCFDEMNWRYAATILRKDSSRYRYATEKKPSETGTLKEGEDAKPRKP